METKYNYFQAVVSDIERYIADYEIKVVGPNAVDYDSLYDDMFNSDYVTGNMSGSYTMDRWQASKFVCHNEDLLLSALVEFDLMSVPCEKVCSPEWCDVIIRCYLLRSCLDDVLDGIKEDAAGYYETHNMEG